MSVKFGLNGATLPKSDLLTGIRSAAAAGFRYYEPRIPELENARASANAAGVRSRLAELGLAWLPLNALEGLFAIPDGEIERRAQELFALAAEFGVSQLIAVPGSVDGPSDRTRAIALLKRLAASAAERGLSLLYEFIGFSHHAFPSLAEARTIASSAGLPMVLDTFHLAVSRTAMRDIERVEAEEIGLIHLSDALVAEDVARIVDRDRVLPGEGALPLDEIMGAVLSSGFGGPISIEVFHPKYGDRPPEAVAHDAFGQAVALHARVQGRHEATPEVA